MVFFLELFSPFLNLLILLIDKLKLFFQFTYLFDIALLPLNQFLVIHFDSLNTLFIFFVNLFQDFIFSHYCRFFIYALNGILEKMFILFPRWFHSRHSAQGLIYFLLQLLEVIRTVRGHILSWRQRPGKSYSMILWHLKKCIIIWPQYIFEILFNQKVSMFSCSINSKPQLSAILCSGMKKYSHGANDLLFLNFLAQNVTVFPNLKPKH